MESEVKMEFVMLSWILHRRMLSLTLGAYHSFPEAPLHFYQAAFAEIHVEHVAFLDPNSKVLASSPASLHLSLHSSS